MKCKMLWWQHLQGTYVHTHRNTSDKYKYTKITRHINMQTHIPAQMYMYCFALGFDCKFDLIHNLKIIWHWMWPLYVTSLYPQTTHCNLTLSCVFLSLKIDQSFMLSSVFYSYPFSSTVCIASKISPRALSIRHAKVKTSYCHLAWLNVNQARLNTLTYGI